MLLYFSTAAQQELDDAFEYLELQQLSLGYRFTADVDEALARIRNSRWHGILLDKICGVATLSISVMA